MYPSLADATSTPAQLRTSQLALPADMSQTVYASDGYSLQLATVTGDVSSGYTAVLNVPV